MSGYLIKYIQNLHYQHVTATRNQVRPQDSPAIAQKRPSEPSEAPEPTFSPPGPPERSYRAAAEDNLALNCRLGGKPKERRPC